MLRATIKSLLGRKLRLALTALAVVLGVGMTAGSFILTDTALKSFDSLFGDLFKGTDVVVQATTAFEPGAAGNSGGGSERKPIPESVLPQVQAVDGVGSADGSIGGTAWIVDPATNKVVQNGGAPPIGGSWDPNTTTLTVDAGGAPPAAPDQVVVDAGTALDHDLSVGQRIKVVTSTGPGQYTISGIIRLGTSNSLLGATLALFDLPTAQKLFDREGELDAIYVKGDGSVSPDQLAAGVGAVLPEGYQAITAASAAAEQQDQVGQGLGFLRTFFLIFGFVALFVGAFIIFNTFNIVVSQRSRELALFRALGARRRQVMTSVMVESAIVGLIASLGGVLLGMALAKGLEALLSGLGLQLPTDGARRRQPHDHRVDRARHGHHDGGRLSAGAAGRATRATRGAARQPGTERLDPASGRGGLADHDRGHRGHRSRPVRGCVERWARRWPRRRAHLPRGRDAVAAVRQAHLGRDRPPLPRQDRGPARRREREPQSTAHRLHRGGADDRARSGRVRLGVRGLAEGIGDRHPR